MDAVETGDSRWGEGNEDMCPPPRECDTEQEARERECETLDE